MTKSYAIIISKNTSRNIFMTIRFLLKRPHKVGITLIVIGLVLFLTSWIVFPLDENLHFFHQFVDNVITATSMMFAGVILIDTGLFIWSRSVRKHYMRELIQHKEQ